MRAALAGRDLESRPDGEAHCIAAGLIARRCSVTESLLASFGKEIRMQSARATPNGAT